MRECKANIIKKEKEIEYIKKANYKATNRYIIYIEKVISNFKN